MKTMHPSQSLRMAVRNIARPITMLCTTGLLLNLCLAPSATVAATWQPQLINYAISVYVHDATGPINTARVGIYNLANTDSLIMYTNAEGYAIHNADPSAVPSNLPQRRSLGHIFPNPAAGTASIFHYSADKSAITSLKLYNLQGQALGTLTTGENLLNRPLAAGVYLIKDQITGDEAKFISTSGTKRIIIRNGNNKTNAPNKAPNSIVSDISANINISKPDYINASMPITLQGDIADEIAIEIAGINTPLIIKAYNITGDIALIDGDITISRNGFTQTASADSIGEYNFTIPTSTDSIAFDVTGFLGYDGTQKIFSVLNPDSVAVKGWIADDETKAATANLPSTIYLEMVPEERINNPLFMESVGGVAHRREDTRFILYTNTDNSNFIDPAPEVDLNKLRTARDNYFAIIAGGSLDQLALEGYTSIETNQIPIEDIYDLWGRHDMWVQNDSPPGNTRLDWDRDGDIDYAYSHISNHSSQGDANDEILGPTVLYDNQVAGTISNTTNPDGSLNNNARDLVNTVSKSRLGRDFDP